MVYKYSNQSKILDRILQYGKKLNDFDTTLLSKLRFSQNIIEIDLTS